MVLVVPRIELDKPEERDPGSVAVVISEISCRQCVAQSVEMVDVDLSLSLELVVEISEARSRQSRS